MISVKTIDGVPFGVNCEGRNFALDGWSKWCFQDQKANDPTFFIVTFVILVPHHTRDNCQICRPDNYHRFETKLPESARDFACEYRITCGLNINDIDAAKLALRVDEKSDLNGYVSRLNAASLDTTVVQSGIDSVRGVLQTDGTFVRYVHPDAHPGTNFVARFRRCFIQRQRRTLSTISEHTPYHES